MLGLIKKCGVVLLIFCIFISCNSITIQKHKEADAHYKLGILHMREGKLQPAFVEFHKAIKLNPKEKRAYYLLGLIYQEFGDFLKAEDSFKKAINIDPDYSEAYNSLGVLYIRMKNWQQAIWAFNKALDNPLYSNPEKALTNLGRVYYRIGKYKKAIKFYKKAIKRVPEFAIAYYGLALCYNVMEHYGEAAEVLSKAIELDPFIKGDHEKARKYFTELKSKALTPEESQDYADLIEILNY